MTSRARKPMWIILSTSVLLVAAVLLAACSSDDDDAGDDTTTTTASTSTTAGNGSGGEPTVFTDPDGPISVTVGEEFVIRLESNPSTGYEWTVTTEPDTNIAEPTGASTDPVIPDDSPPGTPGHQDFTYEAIGAGNTTATFTYARSFDPTDDPTVLDVEIQAS